MELFNSFQITFRQIFEQGDRSLIERFFHNFEERKSLYRKELHPKKVKDFEEEPKKPSKKEARWIKVEKILASLVVLSEERVEEKAEVLYEAYKEPMHDHITSEKIKELVEHLYFLVLQALPSLLDFLPPKQLEHLLNMQQKAISDKLNIHKFLSGNGANFRSKEQFVTAVCSKPMLFNTSGLRSRVQSVLHQNTAHVVSKLHSKLAVGERSTLDSSRTKKIVRFAPKATFHTFKEPPHKAPALPPHKLPKFPLTLLPVNSEVKTLDLPPIKLLEDNQS